MNLVDKVPVVTGGTSGIGFETALGLSNRGATLILVGRNPAKGATARAAIRERIPTALVDVVAGDLSSLAGVREISLIFTETARRSPRSARFFRANAAKPNFRYSATQR